MSFFVQLLEATAVLVPDLLALALVALAFFNLYRIATTLDVAGTSDTDSALQVSLTPGYLVTIAINIVGSLPTPARLTITTVVQLEAHIEQVRRESSPATPRPRPVGHKNAVIES